MKVKPINNKVMYAYFSPDGYIQVRSITDTKKHCRKLIAAGEQFDYKDYEKEGYKIGCVMVDIQIISLPK